MMRMAMFMATNLGVMLVAGIVMRIFGIDQMVGGGMAASLIYCALFGFVGSFISLIMSKGMAKRSSQAQVIENPQNETEQWLVDTTKRISEQAGIGMPEVAIFPSQEPNAFATGWKRNDALMAVSVGLLNTMNRDEVEGVIAHEIGHIANGDMITMALVQGVMNTFVVFFARIIGRTVDQALFRGNGYGIGYFITYMLAQVVLGFVANAISMWFSRFREYRADSSAAELAGREKMIAALEKLKGPSAQPSQMPDTLVAFGINGGMPAGIRALFRSHPTLDDRINALRNAA